MVKFCLKLDRNIVSNNYTVYVNNLNLEMGFLKNKNIFNKRNRLYF